ncbi:MAG: hypothetical protein U9R56_01455 [candidate division Zixibacteria bacterium]|nr:hypothetical protein [candidate division Zixibacteria bacterium]
MKLFKKKKVKGYPESIQNQRLTTAVKTRSKTTFRTADQISSMLKIADSDVRSGRYRTLLYRFLADNIPVVNTCIWTWSRLAAAPGRYEIIEGNNNARLADKGLRRLERLAGDIYLNATGQSAGMPGLLVDMFTCLFRDGIFGGFVTVRKDASGVDRLVPVDPINISRGYETDNKTMVLEFDDGTLDLARPDFHYVALNAGISSPLGRSVLRAVPFVSYIEQQLVDDMRRTSHNSGFHRLHVKITPPERAAGEADGAYMDRINSYFDSTVSMIKSCEVDDNPVTWDNVEIEYIGPPNSRAIGNTWFFNHRAMIEEVCTGTNLAPFLLGYSYGATTSWSGFKFDMVMRQVRSVQAEAAQFLEWIGNIDLALAGLDLKCRFVFDNTFAYQATDKAAIESRRVDSILKLYQAGLLDEETARKKVGDLV